MQQDNEIIDIIKDYKEGMHLTSLSKKYHHTFYTIKKILLENNIELRKTFNRINKNLEPKIIKDYLDNKNLKEIAKNYSISEQQVENVLLNNKIKLRNSSECALLRHEQNAYRKYSVNENYFKVQSSNMAYILGFLAADGSVAKNSNEIRIGLASKDVDILEKIKKELNYEGSIKYFTNSDGHDMVKLSIACKEYKKDLAIYNIIPQKTFKFSMPENLDKKYWIDFIRGYWDGDGTICSLQNSGFRSSLCSVRKIVLEQILNFLEKEYNIPQVNIYTQGKYAPLYYFQYSSNSTRKLFNAMYYKEDLLYLDRKYKKFCELCIDDKHPRDSIS